MTEIESLSEADAANELMRLAKTIAHHSKRYHAEDAPELSDADYDALVRRNNELENAFHKLVHDDNSDERRVRNASVTMRRLRGLPFHIQQKQKPSTEHTL